jgi:HAD superfamily hydrolase (TIGR01484 family)
MDCPRAAIFDLDDTLAESFKAPADSVLRKLCALLEHIPVAIMTGAGFKRMESQFLPTLAAAPRADRFYLFPNSSAQCYIHEQGVWQLAYNLALSEEERIHIKEVIQKTLDGNEELKNIAHFGERMFDREAQVAYTPVGIEAPLEVKQTWDPGGIKRKTLWKTLKEAMPEFEILLGGTTTIDITRKGINKAHGVGWLSEHLGIPASEMLYVGDAFYDDGNDAVVIPTGIKTKSVSGPVETEAIIDELLKACQ